MHLQRQILWGPPYIRTSEEIMRRKHQKSEEQMIMYNVWSLCSFFGHDQQLTVQQHCLSQLWKIKARFLESFQWAYFLDFNCLGRQYGHGSLWGVDRRYKLQFLHLSFQPNTIDYYYKLPGAPWLKHSVLFVHKGVGEGRRSILPKSVSFWLLIWNRYFWRYLVLDLKMNCGKSSYGINCKNSYIFENYIVFGENLNDLDKITVQ